MKERLIDVLNVRNTVIHVFPIAVEDGEGLALPRRHTPVPGPWNGCGEPCTGSWRRDSSRQRCWSVRQWRRPNGQKGAAAS